MPWLAFAPVGREPAPDCSPHLDVITSFAAASCWYSIVLAKAALRMGELATAEAFGTRRKSSNLPVNPGHEVS
jgi:hypothetical protein